MVFIKLVILMLIIAIFARVLLAWFPTASTMNPIVALIYQLTEPILAPLRRIIPRIGIFDLAPTVALLILFAVLNLL